MFCKRTAQFFVLAFVIQFVPAAPAGHAETSEHAQVVVHLEPTTTRAIGGVSELDRKVYFAISDSGRGFDRRCRDPERYNHLVNELRISFGRELGVVAPLVRYGNYVQEDASRPGFVDLEHLKQKLAKRGISQPSEVMRRDFPQGLDVAAHGKHGAFPEFMGRHTTPQVDKESDGKHSDNVLPENIDAAAELSAAALKYAYSDFDRPRYYEPMNEPHWSYFLEDHIAKWHLATMEAVHREVPGVQVGGPCLSVAYFYRNQYNSFKGLRRFIDDTQCRLDFYSFHVYDYYRNRDGKFGGRITGGLPLEGMFDLVENYTHNRWQREVPIVVSETGGYGADDLIEQLTESFPEKGWEREMKKRSLHNALQIRSSIANTLVFMDHPHVVKKAVPFILLESMSWDPTYYATLYTPYGYEDKSRWVASTLHRFYEFFRDLEGRRVVCRADDPDIQARAFVHENTLFLVMNNLSDVPHRVQFDMDFPVHPRQSVVRRIGQNADFTPYLREEGIGPITIAGGEAVLIRADYAAAIPELRRVDERAWYGDAVVVPVEDSRAKINIAVDERESLAYAQLRIGLCRPQGAGHDVRVRFNGRVVPLVEEHCAERLDDYGT
ncbi:MAG: beta-agarase, partial [Planctomycetota bacterium]